jgi:mannose-1-phosphate guanylyltransferase
LNTTQESADSPVQAIILCGGKGTRLSSLYSDRPKVLVPIAGRPFLEWQLLWLAGNGIRRVHLAAGHQADILRSWLQNGGMENGPGAFTLTVAGRSVQVTLSVETAPLGTAGGLKFVESFIRSDPFLVLNGDSLSPNLDFAGLLQVRRENQAAAAILTVAPIEEPGRYGTVEMDGTGRITAFREKTERGSGWINAGVYLMRSACLHHIETGRNLSIETDIFPNLAKAGELLSYRARPPLLDMGTPQGIEAMEQFLALCAGKEETGRFLRHRMDPETARQTQSRA